MTLEPTVSTPESWAQIPDALTGAGDYFLKISLILFQKD